MPKGRKPASGEAAERMVHVVMLQANYDADYGGKNAEGKVLAVPESVADRWEYIGIAEPAGADDAKEYDETQQGRRRMSQYRQQVGLEERARELNRDAESVHGTISHAQLNPQAQRNVGNAAEKKS